ncbi:MAG: MotA/TolQ/ExbB proton channel family protein [Bacteroidaceae bacterium]|nr:MotA/TolQ/ExbB proton channel family protein [Bacteroidaceae bacterium]
MIRSTLWIILTIIAAAAVLLLNGVTTASLVVILSFFLYALWNIWIENRAYRIVSQVKNDENIIESIRTSSLSTLWDEYEKTLAYNIDGLKKTNIPSSEIFSVSKITRINNLNLRIIDAASGTLVGLGLLGTFLGLTLGVRNFDTANVQNIQSSIQSLLDGMSTAFLTSLLGMGFSIVYTLIEKRYRNLLLGSITDLSERLDSEFYIDDQQLLLKLLEPQLSFVNESGERISVSLAIRDILKESEQQSKALKSFSTDLAMQLNDGFDEILSRQMQAKIIPLMENIDSSTKSLIEHVDQMADTVTTPATDLIGTVIDELKKSMSSLITEFRSNISSSASHELEQLVASLSEATTSMGMFPKNMENVTSILQVTIAEVKDAISEITNTSANTNASAMKQMQEQIAFATGAIGNAMTEVKEIMTSLTQTSEQSSQEMITKLSAASEQMGTFLNGVMANVSESVQSSMKSITDDISDKQTDLMALQESTMSETEKLLAQFNTGLERLEKMNEYIIGTMNTFQQAQGQITGSTAHLQMITNDMKTATEVFHKAQNEYTGNMTELQKQTQRAIDSVVTLLDDSGQLSEDYVEKFETIKNGLTAIFAQIQKGLTEYSQTMQASTQKYLEQYSMNLTKTTDALAGTIERQSDIAELFVDALDKHRQK